MALRPRYDFSDLRRLAADARVSAEELQRDLVRDVASASIAALVASKQKAPLFTGELAGGIAARGVRAVNVASGFSITDVVFSPSPHALVQEEGREVGAKAPPLGPIFRWVKLRSDRGNLDLSWTGKKGDAAVLAAAIKIRLVIKRRGLPPRLFMKAGEAAGQTELDRRLAATLERWRRRVES